MRRRSQGRLGVVPICVLLLAACSDPSTPTSGPPQTGIPYVDAVIDAGLSGDPQAIRELIHLGSFPCTVRSGLGGPPKCLPGEAEGTMVQAFPVLGSEGGHVRAAELDSWEGIGQPALAAVYRTGTDTYADEFFPAGEYAVAFTLTDPDGTVTMQVTQDGIVRIEHGFGLTLSEMYEKHKEDFLLAPFVASE
jgi:hypothetical protein